MSLAERRRRTRMEAWAAEDVPLAEQGDGDAGLRVLRVARAYLATNEAMPESLSQYLARMLGRVLGEAESGNESEYLLGPFPVWLELACWRKMKGGTLLERVIAEADRAGWKFPRRPSRNRDRERKKQLESALQEVKRSIAMASAGLRRAGSTGRPKELLDRFVELEFTDLDSYPPRSVSGFQAALGIRPQPAKRGTKATPPYRRFAEDIVILKCYDQLSWLHKQFTVETKEEDVFASIEILLGIKERTARRALNRTNGMETMWTDKKPRRRKPKANIKELSE